MLLLMLSRLAGSVNCYRILSSIRVMISTDSGSTSPATPPPPPPASSSFTGFASCSSDASERETAASHLAAQIANYVSHHPPAASSATSTCIQLKLVKVSFHFVSFVLFCFLFVISLAFYDAAFDFTRVTRKAFAVPAAAASYRWH